MQVYKVFFKVIGQQKFSIAIYVVVFSVLILLFGQLGGNSEEGNFEETKYNIVVMDEDHSDVSKALLCYLGKWSSIKDYSGDEQKIQDALYARTINAAITIPKGFGNQLEADPQNAQVDMMSIPGTMYETIMTARISKFLRPLSAYLESGMEPEEAIRKANATVEVVGDVSLLKKGSTGEYPPVYFFFTYMPYILITVFAVGIGPAVMVFEKKELANRNDVSAYSFSRKNAEIVFGMLTAALVFCIFLFVVAAVVYQGDFWNIKGVYFCINGLSFAMTAMSITYLITSFAVDRNILNMAGNVIGLAFSFIGGIFVPLDVMPKAMQNLSKFIPVYWFAQANKGIMNEDITFSNIGGYLLIQLGFSVAMITVALAVKKARKA